MKLICLKSSLKSNSFDVSIGIEIPFFLQFWLLLSWVGPYLQFVTTNCLKINSELILAGDIRKEPNFFVSDLACNLQSM